MSKFTLIKDSSQISTFLECQTLMNYQYQKHLLPSQMVQPVQDVTPLNAGTYGHKLLDIFYKCRAAGLSFNDSMGRAFTYNPDTDTCTCGCHFDSHKVIPALGIRECHRCKKCINFTAKPFDLTPEVRMTVQTSIRNYFAKYATN